MDGTLLKDILAIVHKLQHKF